MLRPRIIPCLLIRGGGLVKTVGFGPGKYVGDPLNAVRIFNEKEVDELTVLDIDATVEKREPNYALIRDIASECRMPLCYGGGVTKVEEFQRIVSLGVEKVAISASAVSNPGLVSKAAETVGAQSVVVVMDVKKDAGGYTLRTHNGTRTTDLEPAGFSSRMQELGAGEIVVNSIDRDGEMKGYDLELVARVRAATSLPLTILGGAGSIDDIASLVRSYGIIGAAAGSLFVFKGVYRAVLINYPGPVQKDGIIAASHGRNRE
ncbi:MAG TPA: AglZ/HisF2 family acetamidino modification protein [Vicinamibacterales bacterium]|nr:AglZ/HisF2 family acetamidino modification protein [Vicinamibacterales bacterium]